MKKFILIGLSLFSIIASKNSAAQSFSFPKDTVTYAVQGYVGKEDIHNDIKNETSGSLTLNWKIISENLPASWESGFGLCDNVLCYANGILGNPGTTQTTMGIPNGATMPFKMSMDFSGATAGTYYVTVHVTDGAVADTMTFLMTKFPTSVANTRSSGEGISIYPNPANEELNVLFSANSGVKTLTVYNMIGKAVTVYKASASNSAKLDIQNLPAGVYFVRLSDAQGHIVATRKFTRQ